MQDVLVRVVSTCALLGTVLGCAGVSEEMRKEMLKETSRSSQDFLLGPEDMLEVVVWRHQDLSREVVVRPDGMISVPLIGDVRVSGLTADELAQRIAARMEEFKESPMVSVHVKEVNSYSVYVLGEVTNPGKFQLKTYTTLLHAIALAGGFTEFASRNDIQVIRKSVNGNGTQGDMHIPVRYDDLLDGEGEVGNFLLNSGDILVVP